MNTLGNSHAFVLTYHLDSFMPEAMDDAVSGGALDHLQLAKGRFRGNLLHARLGDSQLDWGGYNLPLMATGDLPADKVTLACILRSGEEGWLNGIRVVDATPVIVTEQSELLYRLGAQTQWMAFQIDRKSLEDVGIELPEHGVFAPRAEAHDRHRLQQCVFNVVKQLHDFALDGPANLNPEGMAAHVQTALLAEFCRVLDQGEPAGVGRTGRLARPQQTIERARAYLDAHIDQPIRISQLCSAAGTSWRTLERAFLKIYGMPPKQWLNVYRLSVIRRKLASATSEETSVTSVAHRHGIQHLGRFAATYREMFGETPVETLKRRPG